MKQKLIAAVLILVGCSLFASPKRKGSPCPYDIKKETVVVMPAVTPAVPVVEELDYYPMHQMMNSLL